MESDLCKINKYLSSDNLGQNIVGKSTKLSKTGFPMECFRADFLQFCSVVVKNCLWGSRQSTYPSILSILTIFLKFLHFLRF